MQADAKLINQLPLKRCGEVNCRELIREGKYCEKHIEVQRERFDKIYDAKRGSSAKRGYGYRWQKASKMFRDTFPRCATDRCGKWANEVHHVIPKRDGGGDNWDNLMSLCKECHSKLTAKGQ